MGKIGGAVREIHRMDRTAARDQWVNRLHPLVKFILTVVYIAAVVSFGKYDVPGLMGMSVYLIAGFMLAELSVGECLWRLRVVLPLVCMVGLANPFLETAVVDLGFLQLRAGVISMVTLMMKGVFAVLASYLLAATTSAEGICYALRLLRVPKILVTQILLTFRYITLLLEEADRITQAYSLRAPGQKGVHFRVWGSLAGQLLLRSVDRAGEVYESMTLRGYQGEFRYMGEKTAMRGQDALYLIFWLAVILLFRKIPVILVVGNLTGGLFS